MKRKGELGKPTKEELFKIQGEMLEISIKIGRRMMHDYGHILNDVPKDNMFKDDYQERYKFYKSIFYPDKGLKNYRLKVYNHISNLEEENSKMKKLLKENGIKYDDGLPF